MKKLVCCLVVLCVTVLHAEDRFFLYGKILGADGQPLPSAQISLSTVIERQPVTSTQAGPDGSFKLVVTGRALGMLKFSSAASDSFMLPLLLTTEQHTLNVTVHLPPVPGTTPGAVTQHASLQMQYGNTELGIAEKLMVSMMEEKRLAGALAADPSRARSGGGVHYRDPDSMLATLARQIRDEQDQIHREAFLLRYIQLSVETKRAGDPAVVKKVLSLVDPSSPFWSLAPELINAAASTPKQYAEYAQRVKALTDDPELKAWLERHP